ncbi:hypothetical protein, partial [Heyndrickxia sporothermodurans]|uniref:hypothetical protein n=1 Tax=Heyndrickxia sporothermodurans TaxID=46224 RepID=UPI001F48ECAE
MSRLVKLIIVLCMTITFLIACSSGDSSSKSAENGKITQESKTDYANETGLTPVFWTVFLLISLYLKITFFFVSFCPFEIIAIASIPSRVKASPDY